MRGLRRVTATDMAQREFILGGQKSGKSRRAEQLAADWLAKADAHRAVLIATAEAHDDEMRERIRRHQRDRAARVPALQAVEAPRELAAALAAQSRADTLVVVDCLTLWLTHWLMPYADSASGQNTVPAQDWPAQQAHFFEALGAAPGPVVLVGNEIGLGVIPLGREVRAFVDALGTLNQGVAAACDRVTLMVAGCPLALKGSL